MQKDIQKSKGETSQQKFENQPSTDKPSVGETVGHKMKEVGHDVNAKLKEDVGVGVGNYSSFEDRKQSEKHGKKYEEKKEKIKDRVDQNTQGIQQTTGAFGHKVQEIAHDVNASLKQNVGVGFGNYSSDIDQQKSQEHKEQYDEKIQPVKQKVEAKTDEIKGNLEEKKEDLKEKAYEGQTGVYTHRLQEVGHTINANLKEKVGVGFGDHSSEVDRQKAEEHWEGYQEKVKECSKTEVSDSNPIVHKIKEVAHTVNANLKEMIGVGVGNYSSEVDRELSQIHHQKYEEKKNTNENLTPSESTGGSFEKNKDKLEGKLFPKAEDRGDESPNFKIQPSTTDTKSGTTNKKLDDTEFPKL